MAGVQRMDIDRESRRLNRSFRKDRSVYTPPECEDTYCGGPKDPCLTCMDGATVPKDDAKRMAEAKARKKRAQKFCCKCGDVIKPGSIRCRYKFCEPCFIHHIALLDKCVRTERVEAKSKGQVCVACARARNDGGKDLKHNRWICGFCARGRIVHQPGVRILKNV